MSALHAADVLLSYSVFVFIAIIQPISGEGGNCSCSFSNSRCDEGGVCRCDPGWDGGRCERCVPMPGCVHGSCLQPWQCSCEPGWGGRFCDKDLSACSLQPCANGATCLMADSGDFSCLCPEGFTGLKCERRIGPCSRRRSPCKNGGLCEDANGFAAELTCRCLAGFSGPRCETDVDDCLMSPCANGATCLDGVNRFSCVCPAGFSGRFCSVNLDDCASRPCLNGGRCLDRAGGFSCVCRTGFAGNACETQLRAAQLEGVTPGWEGGGEKTQRNAVTLTNRNSSRQVDGLLRVTVSERGGRMPRPQLIVLLVLAAMTLAVVALTAILVLQGHCHRDCGATRRRTPTSPSWRTEERRLPRNIGVLNPAEPQKKKLNPEVV
ncbi:protein delta homolog 2 isoform X2 [Salarias fasciatus]|uniref:protein delta homolog 2 isoform X2 n=1 Tax=Salarias fasciatus TaxID=181472 RepID=UPI001176B20B|nr:protein delta homolog 2 isoform X2 [Salarias fasciatus]